MRWLNVSSSLEETVEVNAPVEISWELWSDVTQWPRFLTHVRNVAPLDERSFSWWLSLPGADKSFTAELTEVVPGERIAWRTIDGVEHAGVVTFHRVGETSSEVRLRLTYNPQGFVERLGALTHLDAALAQHDLDEFKHAAELTATTRGLNA